MTLHAIETVFDGYRFRSRLEARWAVVLKTLGVPYEYEKQGYRLDGERYLPDFWLPEHGCWLEIKGEEPSDREHDLAGALAEETHRRVFIFAGPILVPDAEGLPPDGVNGAYMRDSREGGDHYYCWCECSACGAVGLEFDGRADRLPCKECFRCWYGNCAEHAPGTRTGCPRAGGNGDKGYNFASARLIAAFTRARQARFEHGETP